MGILFSPYTSLDWFLSVLQNFIASLHRNKLLLLYKHREPSIVLMRKWKLTNCVHTHWVVHLSTMKNAENIWANFPQSVHCKITWIAQTHSNISKLVLFINPYLMLKCLAILRVFSKCTHNWNWGFSYASRWKWVDVI